MVFYFSLIIIIWIIGYYVNKKVHYTESIQEINSNLSKFGKRMFFLIFIILFTVSSSRYYVGVDYGGYVSLYTRIKEGFPVHAEYGFVVVVKLIQVIFDSPLVMFAVFSLFTISFFLKGIIQQSRNYNISLFLFMSMGYYFLTFNSIRYYLALSMAFYSVKYLISKKYIKFIMFILLASLFHKTVLIVIPVYLIISKKYQKSEYIALFILSICLVVFKEQFRMLAFKIYPYYEGSVYDGGSASVFNIIKAMSVTVLGIFYFMYIKKTWLSEFYFKLNCVAFILYTCCSWIPELSRIGYYLNIGNIILIPYILDNISISNMKSIIKGITILAFGLYIFLMIYQSHSTTIQLLPYKTWFLILD